MTDPSASCTVSLEARQEEDDDEAGAGALTGATVGTPTAEKAP